MVAARPTRRPSNAPRRRPAPTPGSPRRNNAPVRPRPRNRLAATGELFVAAAFGAWTMAAILLAASFTGGDLIPGEAGRALARIFAGLLFGTGVFTFLAGYSMLGDERGYSDHYVVPVIVGMGAGALEGMLVLSDAGNWLVAPFFMLLLALPLARRAARGAFRSIFSAGR
ncbi:MAG: hypothetical protein Kow0010_11970 [Dehalococcoidia bacterium]